MDQLLTIQSLGVQAKAVVAVGTKADGGAHVAASAHVHRLEAAWKAWLARSVDGVLPSAIGAGGCSREERDGAEGLERVSPSEVVGGRVVHAGEGTRGRVVRQRREGGARPQTRRVVERLLFSHDAGPPVFTDPFGVLRRVQEHGAAKFGGPFLQTQEYDVIEVVWI